VDALNRAETDGIRCAYKHLQAFDGRTILAGAAAPS
jgi:hypothetical protein